MTLTSQQVNKICSAVLKVWIAFALVIWLAASHEARADLSVAVGGEASESARYLELRHDAKWWGVWVATNGSTPRVGIEAHTNVGRLLLGVGTVFSHPDERVSTAGRYSLRAEWSLTDTFSLGIVHESNCRNICKSGALAHIPHGSENSNNDGYNFLILRMRW